jgi:hypothetical protein
MAVVISGPAFAVAATIKPIATTPVEQFDSDQRPTGRAAVAGSA